MHSNDTRDGRSGALCVTEGRFESPTTWGIGRLFILWAVSLIRPATEPWVRGLVPLLALGTID